MTPYTDVYELVYGSTAEAVQFQQQVSVAIKAAANAIFAESAGTANHAERIQWARNVTLTDKGPLGWTHKMIWRVLDNGTVRTAAIAGTATDSNVQTVLDSLVDEFALG
jgi:hypothetical protein